MYVSLILDYIILDTNSYSGNRPLITPSKPKYIPERFQYNSEGNSEIISLHEYDARISHLRLENEGWRRKMKELSIDVTNQLAILIPQQKREMNRQKKIDAHYAIKQERLDVMEQELTNCNKQILQI